MQKKNQQKVIRYEERKRLIVDDYETIPFGYIEIWNYFLTKEKMPRRIRPMIVKNSMIS